MNNLDYPNMQNCTIFVPSIANAIAFYTTIIGLKVVDCSKKNRLGLKISSVNDLLNGLLTLDADSESGEKRAVVIFVGNIDEAKKDIIQKADSLEILNFSDVSDEIRHFYILDPFGNRVEFIETQEIDKHLNEIRDGLLKKIGSGKPIKNNHLRSYMHLNAYRNFMAAIDSNPYAPSVTFRAIKALFNKYKDYLDGEHTKSLKKKEFLSHVFELVMAHKLTEANFNLDLRENHRRSSQKGKPPHAPDLEFDFHGKRYLFECTTRFTTPIDEYTKDFQFYEGYIIASKILKAHWEKKCKKLPLYRSLPWHQDVGQNIEQLFNELPKTKKNVIKEKLGLNSASDMEIVTKITKWIKTTQNIYYLFSSLLIDSALKKYYTPSKKSFLPSEYTKELIELKLPFFGENYDQDIINRSSARLIADCLIDKLSKNYAHEEKPLIVAISLALLPNLFDYSLNHSLLSNILPTMLKDSLLVSIIKKREKLNQEIVELQKMEKSTQETEDELTAISDDKLRSALSNLYAILIDRSSYNWFNELNQFDVIYNNGSTYYASERRILDSLAKNQKEEFNFCSLIDNLT